jgi:hypothetical protein
MSEKFWPDTERWVPKNGYKPRMCKRVYRFTSTPLGISYLQNRRLKLSTIHPHDPFGLAAMTTLMSYTSRVCSKFASRRT